MKTETRQRSRGGGKRLSLCVVFALVSISSVSFVTASDQKQGSQNPAGGKGGSGPHGGRRGRQRGVQGGGPPARPPSPSPEEEPIFGTFVKTGDGGVRGVADSGGNKGRGHHSPHPGPLPPPVPPRVPLRSSSPPSGPRAPKTQTDPTVTYAELQFPRRSPRPPLPPSPGSHGSHSSPTTPGSGAPRPHHSVPQSVSSIYATLNTPKPESPPPVPPPRSVSLLPPSLRSAYPHHPTEDSTGGGGSPSHTRDTGHKKD
ncbi:putative transmembrane protein [Toxoplasma gondii VAND]|uniref:Putative transmembrane protein n=1 Tax=Toxoplasma gondii VAND TaxID=933077 RepID=A0A086QI88_TOXGO|nr:putative transmembrane protein [Toxoplasma gondii VAND]